MHDMHLGDATRDDAPALLALLCETGLSSWDDFDPDRAMARWDEMKRALPTSRVLVLRRCDGTILATLTLVLLPMLGHSGAPSALVEDVSVMPVVQRHGLGRQLMNAAMDAARAAGCYKLALSSNVVREKAHAFYESLGFERHGVSFVATLSAPAATQPWEREDTTA
jgi:GNAT superfamily N-acetyltransferase